MHQHKLGVNIDHVATLRQARGTKYPDPVFAALIAEQAGASNITLHIREDRRHAQERDLELLKKTISIKVNLEMAPTADLKRIALQYRPTSCTLVPEKRHEVTTEGGMDLLGGGYPGLKKYVADLKKAGIEVSLFIDPDDRQVTAAAKLGAQAVEFNSGRYAEAESEEKAAFEAEKIRQAAVFALSNGLKAHVGHGINYHNVRPLVELGLLEEFNIGHAIVARAVMVGFERSVKEMRALLA
ncbi:MAG TPA: pyridoxine 5'-phosphate synthase [bacterium]|nr:pyridoxine 5'-phosphate synthase [bacterium]